MPDIAHASVGFDDNRLASELFGQFDQNLAILEKRLGIEAVARGNQVTIRGPAHGGAAGAAPRSTCSICACSRASEIGPADVEGAVRMAETADEQLSLPSSRPRAGSRMAQISTRAAPSWRRNPAQDAYIRAMDRAEMVFGIGPAGTGKTYLAVAYARRADRAGRRLDRLILSRPAVEAGRAARLPARRHEGEGRPLSPPALRRALRHDAARPGRARP